MCSPILTNMMKGSLTSCLLSHAQNTTKFLNEIRYSIHLKALGIALVYSTAILEGITLADISDHLPVFCICNAPTSKNKQRAYLSARNVIGFLFL